MARSPIHPAPWVPGGWVDSGKQISITTGQKERKTEETVKKEPSPVFSHDRLVLGLPGYTRLSYPVLSRFVVLFLLPSSFLPTSPPPQKRGVGWFFVSDGGTAFFSSFCSVLAKTSPPPGLPPGWWGRPEPEPEPKTKKKTR